jgi:hypothetical protein
MLILKLMLLPWTEVCPMRTLIEGRERQPRRRNQRRLFRGLRTHLRHQGRVFCSGFGKRHGSQNIRCGCRDASDWKVGLVDFAACIEAALNAIHQPNSLRGALAKTLDITAIQLSHMTSTSTYPCSSRAHPIPNTS